MEKEGERDPSNGKGLNKKVRNKLPNKKFMNTPRCQTQKILRARNLEDFGKKSIGNDRKKTYN